MKNNKQKLMIAVVGLSFATIINAQVVETNRNIPTGLEGSRGLTAGSRYTRGDVATTKNRYAPGPVITKNGVAKLGTEGENFEALTIAQAISQIPELAQLKQYIEQHPQIKQQLNNAYEKITLLAPTNQAFADVRAELAGKTLAEKAAILRNHISKGIYSTESFLNKVKRAGQQLIGQVEEQTVAREIKTKNGVIRIVDNVILEK
ncbi:MAG: Fasciclin domain protein [Candidatus Dependentiae bacterium ADurb.Bin331]|nr:MAG: Fasciclin domain protein [Candidatus Dependentiae bacterium ADurb.Bin331]